MQRRGDSEPAGEPLLALPSRRTNPERLIVLLRLVVKGLQWRKPGNSQPSSRQMLQDTGSLPPPTGADACEAARAPHDLIAPTIAVPVKRAGLSLCSQRWQPRVWVPSSYFGRIFNRTILAVSGTD